jgi:hypothetical protein
MKAWLGIVGALALLALGATPAQAGQNPAGLVEWPHGLHEFRLDASDGYRLQVTDTGDGHIYLTAQRGHSVVQYSVRGAASTDNGLKARFPGVGRIAVDFRPVGHARRVAPAGNCKGAGNLVQRGVFEGTIRFRGERGYSSAHATRAKGEVVTSARQTCRNLGESGGGHGGAGDIHVTFLNAFAKRHGAVTGFSASKWSSASQPAIDVVFFSASLASHHHGMFSFRSVSARANPAAIEMTGERPLPDSLVVTPPGPFQGSGQLERLSKSATNWSGTLSVEFPGAGIVPLAGPEFSSELCVDRHCTGKGGTSIFITSGRAGMLGE